MELFSGGFLGPTVGLQGPAMAVAVAAARAAGGLEEAGEEGQDNSIAGGGWSDARTGGDGDGTDY